MSFIPTTFHYNARVKQFIAILFLVGNVFAAEPLPLAKVNTLIEALGRLDPALVNSNPALKERLNQVLDAVRGEPRSVALIKKFQVPDREADLLAVAAMHPNAPAGVEAMGMVLAGNGKKAVAALLTGKDAKQAAAVARALGNSNNQKVIPLLAPLVTNAKLHVNVRKEAVKGLANFEAGAKHLLGLGEVHRESCVEHGALAEHQGGGGEGVAAAFWRECEAVAAGGGVGQTQGRHCKWREDFFARSGAVRALSQSGRQWNRSGSGTDGDWR